MAARARRGTGPGDPLADLFFSVAVSPTLVQIDMGIHSMGRQVPSPAVVPAVLVEALAVQPCA
eukprot:7460006-Lingulodinium_polyedra.AAC.1